MNLSNRKPLYLALALTLAAPLAFAQSTYPAKDATKAATAATQDATKSATDAATSTATDAARSTAADANATAQDAAQSATQDATAQTQSAMPKSTGAPEKKNWSDLDTDKNGTLSASEAASVSNLSSVFAKADANADGELTQDEYKAYLAATGKGGKSDSGG